MYLSLRIFPLYIILLLRPSSGLLKSDPCVSLPPPCLTPPPPSTCQGFQLCPLSDSQTYSRLFSLPDAEEERGGTLRWLGIYCWTSTRLWCDMYPEYGLLPTVSTASFSHGEGEQVYALEAECKSSSYCTNCGYWGHRSFNKLHTPTS